MAGLSVCEEGIAARPQSTCFVCGSENPRGLQIAFHSPAPGAVEARWTPPKSVEGYAGLVHGGVVAAVLDEAMSKAAASLGAPALTARLEVRYRHPVPSGLGCHVRGEVIRADRRRIFVRASLAGPAGQPLAESKACFIRKS